MTIYYTIEELKIAVIESKTFDQVAKRLGMKGSSASLRNKIKTLKLDLSHFTRRITCDGSFTYTSSDLQQAILGSKSYLEINKKLGLKGINHKSLKERIRRLNLDVSHISLEVGVHGQKLSEILVENSNFLKNMPLKKQVI